MRITSVLLLAVSLMARPSQSATDKLHGKVIVSDAEQVKIALTIQPRETMFRLSGHAPVAVGEYVDFDFGPHNTVRFKGAELQITEVTMVP